MELLEATPAVWQDLHARAPEATVFTAWNFHQLVHPEAQLLVVCDRRTPIVGVWLTEVSLPFAKYQGILTGFLNVSGDDLRRRLRLIRDVLREVAHRCDEFALTFSPAFEHGLSLSWFAREPSMNVALTSGWSAVISTRSYASYDVYVRAVNANRRRDLRHARHLSLTDACDGVDLERLLRLTFKRQSLAVMDSLGQMIGRYWEFAKASGRVNAAVLDDRIVAATLFLHDARAGYYIMGASERDPATAGASTLLLMDQIRYCFDRGLERVDLLGANDLTRGHFKLSFAATPVAYLALRTTACPEVHHAAS